MKTKMLTILGLGAASLAFSGTALADHHGDGKHGGKMFEKHDTNGDGVITKDEFIAHAEARFEKMDADGNGEVTMDEAKAGREKMREKMQEMKQKREGMDAPEGEKAE